MHHSLRFVFPEQTHLAVKAQISLSIQLLKGAASLFFRRDAEKNEPCPGTAMAGFQIHLY